MTALLTLFLNNLFPILLVARIGYLAGKLLHIEPKALSKVVFYVFSPSLIFNLLITSQLNNDDIFRMMGFAATQFFLMGFIAWVAGRIFKLERKLFVAVILVAISVNAGNYGMSLNLFAFGEEALAYAGLYFTTAAILTYTVGVTIASMGSKNLGQSLAQLIKIPTVYAVVLAIIFNLTGTSSMMSATAILKHQFTNIGFAAAIYNRTTRCKDCIELVQAPKNMN